MIEVNYNNLNNIKKQETGLLKAGHEMKDAIAFMGLMLSIISIIIFI